METASTYHVLVLDDDHNQGDLLQSFLEISGPFIVDPVISQDVFWELVTHDTYDVIFLDYKMPGGANGLEVLGQLAERKIHVPVIMMTGEGDERVAAQAIQRGAVDYLIKGTDILPGLPALIQNAIRVSSLQRSVEQSLEQIRYQALLLNNVRDAVVVWNPAGKITFWNPAATFLFGWSSAERLDHEVNTEYINEFTPPVQVPSPDEPVGPVIERQYRTKDGRNIWISSRLTPLYNESQLVGYMDVVRDITERMQAQVALRDSEMRYRAIVDEYQTEMIFRFYPDGQLTFVNETFCNVFKKSRIELIGTNFLDLLVDEDREPVKSQYLTLTELQPVITSTYRIKLVNREWRWHECTQRGIFDPAGKPVEYQAIGRDVTDRKQMEVQVKNAQIHLTQAARLASIGELATGVAHQINNPLTTIIAEAQILQFKMSKDQPGQDSIKAIEEAGWRAQHVVQELLEFSQPTSETYRSIDVNKTIQQALTLVGANFQTRGISLEVSLTDGMPNVNANPRQLEDLWVNLLLVTRSFFDAPEPHEPAADDVDRPGQTITLITSLREDKWIGVEIISKGEIAPKYRLDQIFEPVLIPTSDQSVTGMELSICREIVRQNRGEISASRNQLGLTFSVILPLEVQAWIPQMS